MIAHLLPLAGMLPEHDRQLFQDANQGDPLAMVAVLDLVEERWLYINPFEVGRAYYIETLTLYYIGEVVAVHPTWIQLRNASWIHWTGRKSVLMQHKSFDKKHFSGSRNPRTEFVGDWRIPMAGINGWTEWPLESIPMESIQ